MQASPLCAIVRLSPMAMALGLKFRYTILGTAVGWVAICGSAAGLRLVTLPRSSREEALSAIGNSVKHAVDDPSAFGDLPCRLESYFGGRRVTFSDEVDLGCATAFEAAVWNVTRSIPYGETRSYAWVAGQIGSPRACRAVGGALARNCFPIVVPCHRVVASDGGLGGFRGGLAMKKLLLRLEAPSRQTAGTEQG